MRISTEKLPNGSVMLRLHAGAEQYYTQFTVVKPLGADDCELSGFVGIPDRHRLKMLFIECKKLGYSFCHIERRKNGIKTRKIFKL